MLENLDRVDWAQLVHAGGEASDVPGLLRDLASIAAEVRDRAMYELHGTLWHQGTIYEATSYAVPFLLELLQEPAVLKKEQIVALLRTLATGSPAASDDQSVPAYAEEVREATFVGVPLYLELLSDEDADMRIMAAYLLAICDPRSDEIWPVLVEGLSAEPNPVARAARVIALLELAEMTSSGSAPDEVSRTLAELMHSELEPPIVRAASAFFLVSQRDDALKEAQSVLQDSFDAASESLESLPWTFDTDLVGEINEALWETPDARLQRIQERLSGRDQEVRCDSINELVAAVEREPSLAPKVVPHLLKLVTDDDVVVRTYIEIALSEIGATSDLVTPGVKPYLDHPHKGVRLTARMIVQKIETARSEAG